MITQDTKNKVILGVQTIFATLDKSLCGSWTVGETG